MTFKQLFKNSFRDKVISSNAGYLIRHIWVLSFAQIFYKKAWFAGYPIFLGFIITSFLIWVIARNVFKNITLDKK